MPDIRNPFHKETPDVLHIGSDAALTPVEPSPFEVPPESPQLRHWVWSGAVLILILGIIPLVLTLTIPFLHRDVGEVAENYGMRRLWPVDSAVLDSAGAGGVLRPLTGLSLALNYAVGGLSLRGYHLVNALLHLSSALLLYGIVRRTLMPRDIVNPLPRAPFLIAVTTSVLWVMHPLQMQIVTYISNRGELLAAGGLLLALYALIRSTDSAHQRSWLAISLGAAVLAMLSSPSAILLPVVIGLYDRAFLGGSWGEAKRSRRGYYLVLFGTGLLPILLWLLAPTPTALEGTPPIPLLRWFVIQTSWFLVDLRQCFWPWPFQILQDVQAASDAPYLGLAFSGVLLLAGVIGYALWRLPALGLLGFVFLGFLLTGLTLRPAAAEFDPVRSMYLPLASVLLTVIVLLNRLVAGLANKFERIRIWPPRLAMVAVLIVLLVGMRTSVRRLDIFQNPQFYWGQVLAEIPSSAEAQNALGQLWHDRGDHLRATACFKEALRNNPRYAPARMNLAEVLAQTLRSQEALEEYAQTIRDTPGYAPAYVQMGVLLSRSGRYEEAITQFQKALELKPQMAEAHSSFGNTLSLINRHDEAAAEHRQAIALDPANPEFHFRLGMTLARQGQLEEAEQEFQETLQLAPSHFGARGQLRNVHELLKKSRPTHPNPS